MKRQIQKHVIPWGHEGKPVMLPPDAHIMHFAMQQEKPTIWALVPLTSTPIERNIAAFATGTSFDVEPPSFLMHHGTAMHGPFVWHCMEMVR